MAEAQAKHGKDKILMFRKLKDASKIGAAKLALQTDHTWEYSRSTEVTQTKDGARVASAGLEVSLSINALTSDDEVNKMLLDAVKSGEKLEVWEIDITNLGESPDSKKCPAMYAQGNLESWTVPADVNAYENLSTTMKIDDMPKDGEVTLSDEQTKLITYAFRDLEPVADSAAPVGP